MRDRRGKSLIELMVVIATLNVMLLVCVTLMHKMLRSQAGGARSLAESVSLARLANDFRQDVHAAIRAEGAAADAGEPAHCTLNLPDGHVVVYAGLPQALSRTESQDDKVQRRETYALADGEPRFETSPESQLVTLVHRWDTRTAVEKSGNQAALRELRIEAALGHDRRFAVAQRESEKTK